MSAPSTPHVWFITGASTGFGRVLAEQLLERGDRVVATARRPEQLADLAGKFPESALALKLDVTVQADVDVAVAATLARFGRVDVLVNNAGYGIAGAIEEVTEAEWMPVVDTNVFGLLRVTRAWLPHLRAQRSGAIVNLSSIGGLVGGPGIGFYNMTKFAVNGLSEALAAEMAPLGVNVMIVEPGPFRTDFLGRSGQIAERTIPEYDQTAGNMRRYFAEQDGKQPGDPARAASAIIQAIESPEPPKHLVLGKPALKRMKTRLDQWQEELTKWEELSLSADFDAPPLGSRVA